MAFPQVHSFEAGFDPQGMCLGRLENEAAIASFAPFRSIAQTKTAAGSRPWGISSIASLGALDCQATVCRGNACISCPRPQGQKFVSADLAPRGGFSDLRASGATRAFRPRQGHRCRRRPSRFWPGVALIVPRALVCLCVLPAAAARQLPGRTSSTRSTAR